MQRLFVPNEKKEEKGSEKSSAPMYFYCIGNRFELIYDFLDEYRATHAKFEMTKSNIMRYSFPRGKIQLYDSMKNAEDAMEAMSINRFDDLVLRVECITPQYNFCHVAQAEAIFKVSVDSISHLESTFKTSIVLDEKGGVRRASFPCFETSMEHIAEAVGVRVSVDPDGSQGRRYYNFDLRVLSKQYFQDLREQAAFRKNTIG